MTRGADHLIELHFKPEFLRRHGLPDLGYPLTPDALEQIVSGATTLPFADMLFGLQSRSEDSSTAWQELEPAMDRLARLIAPEDERDTLVTAGETWQLSIEPVDLHGPVITIQRGQWLIAAIARRSTGGLAVTSYRPLDGKSARVLIELSRRPHADGTVCMRENNWEYALDCSAGNGPFYAAERGEAYLSFWDDGLGQRGGTNEPPWSNLRALQPRRAASTAVELGAQYSFAPDLV